MAALDFFLNVLVGGPQTRVANDPSGELRAFWLDVPATGSVPG